jgi:hypothetical protein
MTDFGNTVGDDFDRDSTPDKYIERKEPMTPLEAARQIIDARARATQGHFVADANVYGTGKYVCCERGAIPKGDRIAEILESLAGLDSNQAMANAIFFAHAANHAAAVAQALTELVAYIQEDADEDCSYGDGCPQFSGSRHGTCRSCKAKRELARIMGAETHDDA